MLPRLDNTLAKLPMMLVATLVLQCCLWQVCKFDCFTFPCTLWLWSFLWSVTVHQPNRESALLSNTVHCFCQALFMFFSFCILPDLTFVISICSLLIFSFIHSLEPPKFVKKLEPSKIVKAGDSARLECKITGSPEIRVVWYRNEQELPASDKYRMTFIDSVAVIQLNNLSTEDSGDFLCEAQNPAGSTSCSTKIIVKGRDLFLLFLIAWNLLIPWVS